MNIKDSYSNLENINTKIKNNIRKNNNESPRSFYEDALNYKLTLRKKKIQSKLMEIRLKKYNKTNKISSRQKLYEYKKLFEIDRLKQIKEKFLQKESNFLKDKKTAELIYIYSQNINHDENIQNIFNLNDNIILTSIFNEIIKDINSTSIDLDLFDYYLLILGNFFIYTKNIYENNNNDFINLFLNILDKNANLDNYVNENFDIINNTLWLIHLYIYFNKNNYLSNFSNILKNILYFFSPNFIKIMKNFYEKKNKDTKILTIIKEIIFSLLNIYLLIYEEIYENINILPNICSISNDIITNCFENSINILEFTLIKNIYDEIITDIIVLILSINKNHLYLDLSKNKFFGILCNLFNKYKNEDYDNNKIIQNLIIILNKLIDNYYDYKIFWDEVKDSDILPICIQYYLKNGSLVNMTLITLNLFFKYQINYNKILIKCINFKLIEIICDILINVENKENTSLYCLNILLNAYYFLKSNIKNKEQKNIIKYFNTNDGLVAKLEQLLLSQNKDIVQSSSELHYNLTNDRNIRYLFNL